MKTIGILGGMGPEATQLLFKKIVDLTPASKDQEHIPIIIYNNPKIPDRTKAILENGESPLFELNKSAKILENSLVDFMVIPCNTCHFYANIIQETTTVPIINMIKETAKEVLKKHPKTKKVGLLATSGTVATKIYHEEFSKYGIEILTPNEKDQRELVMQAIYGEDGIKAGYHNNPRKLLDKSGSSLIAAGADLIIAGCTEISIVLRDENTSYTVVDPLHVLAKRSVNIALGEDATTLQEEMVASVLPVLIHEEEE